MIQKTFGQLSEGRDNNFDFLRFFLASLVIFSHSFAVLYNGTWSGYDPLLHLTRGQLAFGGGAVDGFFLISGFLITKSWERSRGAGDFARKRLLRILPALIVVLLAAVFVLGPLATTLPLGEYFHSGLTYKYLTFMGTRNLHLTDRLPGVFVHNPLPYRVNGSLWTIRCELLCYLLVAILGLLRCYRLPALVLAASIAAVGVTIVQGNHVNTGNNLEGPFHVLIYFLWGMTFYLYRDKICHSPLLAVSALAGLVVSDIIGILPFTLPLLGGYALFYAAFSARLKLHKFARYGDFSYGIYLYAFPVQQLLVAHFQSVWNAVTLALATFVVAGVCAVLSWHVVEKPWLKRKDKALRIRTAADPAVEMRPAVAAETRV